jgi:hypothetical protein
MLRSCEYRDIKTDYDAISRTFFARDYSPPDGLSFTSSDALFPEGELRQTLGEAYQRQCQLLCYGPYPSWNEVLAAFTAMRPEL